MASQKSFSDAEKVIERFGGIRPMAKKMNVAVTTIQGWKKRQTIPHHRIDQVIEAANNNQVDLSDLITGQGGAHAHNAVAEGAGNDGFTQTLKDVSAEDRTPTASNQSSAAQTKIEVQPGHGSSDDLAESRREQERLARISRENAAMIKQLREQQSSSFTKNIVVSSLMMFIIVGALFVFLLPHKKQLDDTHVQIAALSKDVKTVKTSQNKLKKLVPDNLGQKFEDLQTQATELQQQVKDVGRQASEVIDAANEALNADVTTLGERLVLLEARLNDIADENSTLAGLLDRVDQLQETVNGQAQLTQSVEQLNTLFKEFQNAKQAGVAPDVTIDDALESAQGSDTALGETLAGVPEQDLKAAAYLIGLSKLRSSLNRDKTPFSEDLALMQKFVGKDNPDLQEAMNRLSPKAEEGVLTTQGLSQELKGLAGDIVVASLKGEDITIQDKAKARLNEYLTVEKDGEQVTGTDTQKAIASAQAMLDEGNVEGAIQALQVLDGDAANAAAPWIDEAQNTLASQQIQEMLVQQLLGKLQKSGGRSVSFPSLDGLMKGGAFDPSTLKLDGVLDAVPGDIPLDIDPKTLLKGHKKVVRDEESGVTVLAP